MLAALWSRIQGWLAIAGAVVLVLVGAYAAGGRAARKSAELDMRRRDQKAREVARDVEIDTASMSDDDIVDELMADWVRGHKGR